MFSMWQYNSPTNRTRLYLVAIHTSSFEPGASSLFEWPRPVCDDDHVHTLLSMIPSWDNTLEALKRYVRARPVHSNTPTHTPTLVAVVNNGGWNFPFNSHSIYILEDGMSTTTTLLASGQTRLYVTRSQYDAWLMDTSQLLPCRNLSAATCGFLANAPHDSPCSRFPETVQYRLYNNGWPVNFSQCIMTSVKTFLQQARYMKKPVVSCEVLTVQPDTVCTHSGEFDLCKGSPLLQSVDKVDQQVPRQLFLTHDSKWVQCEHGAVCVSSSVYSCPDSVLKPCTRQSCIDDAHQWWQIHRHLMPLDYRPVTIRRTLPLMLFYSPDQHNGFMSNWFITNFVFDGSTFCCVEQAFMHMKAIHCNDHCIVTAIMRSTRPYQMKRLGRQLAMDDPDAWKLIAPSVMLQCLRAKFNAGSVLANQLS